MSRHETKEAAQDKIMQRMADTLLFASEDGTPKVIVDEIRKQAKRIGKMFGYTSWPGIGTIS